MNLEAVRLKHADLFSSTFRGLECGEGWSALIDETLSELHRRRPHALVSQVKEKLGGLRMYVVDKLDEEAKAILRSAEEHSFLVCAICGCRGSIVSTPGWVRVRCATHEAE